MLLCMLVYENVYMHVFLHVQSLKADQVQIHQRIDTRCYSNWNLQNTYNYYSAILLKPAMPLEGYPDRIHVTIISLVLLSNEGLL